MMVKSPWKQLQPLDPASRYLALASSIPSRSLRTTWRLFKGSRAVAAQMSGTEGAVGFSMLARPLHKEYATLSLWIDETALGGFASSPPHARLMEALGPAMGPTRFVRWTVIGSNGAPAWSEALARLASSGDEDREAGTARSLPDASEVARTALVDGGAPSRPKRLAGLSAIGVAVVLLLVLAGYPDWMWLPLTVLFWVSLVALIASVAMLTWRRAAAD